MHFVRYLFLLIGSLLSICTQSIVSSQEHVISFDSDSTVHIDSSLTVREAIKVLSTGESVIHGIFREFPKDYKSSLGNRHKIAFRVQEVTLDDKPVPYSIERTRRNSKRIYMGDSKVTLSKGIHTYTLVYTIDRQIGFFKDHDELYLNVTGNNWRLPIEQVRAVVHLPAAVQEVCGYTGFQGEKGDDYTSIIEGKSVSFFSTRPFSQREGLTIAVTWPKGFVQEPPLFEELGWFLEDNFDLVGVFFCFLILFFLMAYALFVAHRVNSLGQVKPIFYPPEGLMPSAVGYMKNRRWKPSFLAADIVYLAVRDFVIIDYKKSFWRGAQYSLSKVGQSQRSEELDKDERLILKALFLQGKTFAIDKSSRKRLIRIQEKLKHVCTDKVKKYINENTTFIRLGMKIFIGMLILSVPNINFMKVGLILGAGCFLVVINRYRYTYTIAGKKLQEAIAGFEIYLKTEKMESAKVTGITPVETTELYEKYLPYAIALGVEKQWERQFVSVFNSLTSKGNNRWWYYRHSSFSSSFNRASSSIIPTRSFSGSRGRGSSGGGGGGSGGGGW